MPDFRRAQGRKHTIESVLSIVVSARLAGFESGIGAAQFAQRLTKKYSLYYHLLVSLHGC